MGNFWDQCYDIKCIDKLPQIYNHLLGFVKLTNRDSRIVHYQATLVSHTHWDRAWYCTFQEFRVRLVRLVDNLLEILKNDPDFYYFMLDGQMSVIEDYLEVRPDKAVEL